MMGSRVRLKRLSLVREGQALCPVTCGEFVQGRVGNVDFLVSCPLDLFTEARVWVEAGVTRTTGSLHEQASEGKGSSKTAMGPIPIELEVCSREDGLEWPKVTAAIRRTLFLLWKQVGGVDEEGARVRVKLQRPVPVGKGLGSSTADIVAVAAALGRALGVGLHPWVLAQVALSIEPSNGVMFPGIAIFDHRAGRVARVIGRPPLLDISVFDSGGVVDTLAFNRRSDLEELNRRKEPKVRSALAKVCRGIRCRNPWLLGEGTTQSALAHQPILPKPGLDELAAYSQRHGCYGLTVAHSGTVVGVLHQAGEVLPWVVEKAFTALGYELLFKARVGAGGVR